MSENPIRKLRKSVVITVAKLSDFLKGYSAPLIL